MFQEACLQLLLAKSLSFEVQCAQDLGKGTCFTFLSRFPYLTLNCSFSAPLTSPKNFLASSAVSLNIFCRSSNFTRRTTYKTLVSAGFTQTECTAPILFVSRLRIVWRVLQKFHSSNGNRFPVRCNQDTKSQKIPTALIATFSLQKVQN